MPQININEIDQSIVTRTVSDNIVKVLVPGIASFGPCFDGTNESAVTFTDETAFNKVFGYTEPEYNPIENDVSRIYAKYLIKNGAAVTFVRINDKGEIAEANLVPKKIENGEPTDEPVDRLTPTLDTVALAAKYSDSFRKCVWKTDTNKEVTDKDIESGNYEWADGYDDENAAAFTLCPQIKGIKAKYSGSFGNHLLVTMTPIKSNKAAYAYQYSNISVFYAKIETIVSQKYNEETRILETEENSYIKGITKLESHRVSTNPNSTDYFEDVEFDYIHIEPAANARKELTVFWSNPKPNEDRLIYSGFPEIPLKYKDTNDSNIKVVKYNEYALLSGGTDFEYTDDDLKVLKERFNGMYIKSDSTKVSVEQINKYLVDVYNTIIPNIYGNLNSCYANYTDPYIYDFDFITSGGLLHNEYDVYKTKTDGSPYETDDYKMTKNTTATNPEDLYPNIDKDIVGTVVLRNNHNVIPEIIPTHLHMKELVETRKDCIALFDMYDDYGDFDKNASDVEKDEALATLKDLPNYVSMLDTSYGTVHNPWCWVQHPTENKLVLMPPSFIFLYTMLSNLVNSSDAQKWFPPAGVNRATARIVKKPKYEIGSVILNAWQNDNNARVNPIMKLKNYGYVIYGQYTAYEAIDEFTHSALESLNVRLIANVVKKEIFNTCIKLTFEPNNKALWLKFYDEMDKKLLFMKRNSGLYDYKIVMNESTVTTDDINELRCPGKVYIAPTRTAEFFDIDFIITDAGASFNN